MFNVNKLFTQKTPVTRPVLKATLPTHHVRVKTLNELLRPKAKAKRNNSIISKKIGVEHPANLNLMGELYKQIPILHGGINKTVDWVVGTDYTINSDNPKVYDVLNEFISKKSFHLYLEKTVTNFLVYGTGYNEMVHNGQSITRLKNLNPEYMYMRRSDFMELEGYTQYFGRGKPEYFEPRDIASFPFRPFGDSPYGYPVFASLEKVIEAKLNMEANMSILVNRKANAPIHAKLGDPDNPANTADIQGFSDKMVTMHAKTEWTTNHLVDMKVLDFASKLLDFTSFVEQNENQIVYGIEVPIVLLGRGSIPEGLAEAQFKAFNLRSKSIRMFTSDRLERSVFDLILRLNNLQGEYSFEWEPHEDEKTTEVEKLLQALTLAGTAISEPTRAAIELKIQVLLGIEEEVKQQEEAMALRQQVQQIVQTQQPLLQPTLQQPPQPALQPKIPAVNNQSLLKKKRESVIPITPGMTLEQFTGVDSRGLTPFLSMFLKNYGFGLIALSKSKKKQLAVILLRALSKNHSLSKLSKDLSKVVGDENRAEMIARTESVRATSEASLLRFNSLGLKKAEWDAIRDSRLCKICNPMDGKVFTLMNAKGKIPAHPSCRCSWNPVK